MQDQFIFVKYMCEGATKTMRRAPLVFWLEPLLFILAVFRGICCVDASVNFHEFTVLDGYVCQAEYMDIKAPVSSKTKCLLHCVKTPSCRGVIYEEDTLQCIKCSTEEFLQTASTPAILYKRPVEKKENDTRNFTHNLILDPLSWDDAKVNCENMGGYLASIESNDEQVYVMNLVMGKHSFGAWLGGRGSAHDINSFQWVDGTFVSAGYNNWYRSQVNKITGLDCLKMTKNTNYQWKNKNCTETSPSVCKFG